MGYPVSIKDDKYERNALLFNMCFVFEKEAETESYEQIVRKMARVLRSLEVESELLNRPTSKATVLNIMEQLLEDLNSYSECQIPIKDDANMINLKLFPKCRDPPPVYDYQVPVCVVDLEKVMDNHWDMTMQRIIPYIDGVQSVRRIADIADVDVTFVRIAIQHLLYYGCVKLVDIFQFSNVYAIKSVTGLLHSPEYQAELIRFVARPGRPPPPFAILFTLYCALKYGVTVQHWIEKNKVLASNIDVRRFILYGVVRGFVYRVHKYPMWVTKTDQSAASDSPLKYLRRYLNGHHHYDELCTMFACTPKELDEILKVESAVKILWK
ncbi:Nitrogen permease regulator 2 [Rhizophlyctis rosea]|uniref:Nitrogen permease regulator 2 n=1 Tax=Rhizophlyctis rosea TaxID=64517 RepID=A0AAD5SCJ0_9FUNG|nr:Nitrogen permease regulator 2 [Rhizophlyctis rosea]